MARVSEQLGMVYGLEIELEVCAVVVGACGETRLEPVFSRKDSRIWVLMG